MSNKEKIKFILHIIIPVIICIIPGYVVYPQYIFKPYISTFQIVTTAFMGSVFLASVKVTGIKNSIGILIILMVLNSMLLTKPVDSGNVSRDLFHYAALFLSVYFFFRVIYTKTPPALYPLYMTVIFAASYFSAIAILFLLKSTEKSMPLNDFSLAVVFPALVDAMIGFCLGLGTFINDSYLPLRKKSDKGEIAENAPG